VIYVKRTELSYAAFYNNTISSGMKHSGIELEAMATIAKAAKVRSLEDFQAAVSPCAFVCVIVFVFLLTVHVRFLNFCQM